VTTVWKYTLGGAGSQTLQMPAGAKPIAFRPRAGVLTMWAVVDSERLPTARRFLVTGTGSPMFGAYEHRYIGTTEWGPYIFHLFEELP
jgi:hypothetical protein